MATVLNGPQILIECDGLGRTSKVTHIPTGVDLTPCLKGFTYRVDGKGQAQVSLELCGWFVKLEAKGILENLTVHSLEEWKQIQKAATGELLPRRAEQSNG